jgi:hypothetical protein
MTGDVCLPARDGTETCASDGKSAVACEANHYVLRAICKGPKGCAVSGERVVCDATIAARGDLCAKEGAFACTAEHKDALLCHGRHFEMSRSCRGSLGCDFEDGSLICDESIAREGDLCSKDSLIACSDDGKSELTCIAGVFGRPRACSGGCKVLPHRRIECL